jgi:hypothetical protein
MLPASLDCSFLIASSVFSNVSLSCVLCAQCCQRLWTVHSWLPLRFSLTFICPVSLVPNVAVSLDCSFLIASSVFSNVYLCCVLCAQCFQCLDCSFLITSSVFSNVYLSCVLCAHCCQCFWIVHSWLPHWLFLTFICPVSCAPNVAGISGLFILDYPIGFL